MKRKRFSREQIMAILKEPEAGTGKQDPCCAGNTGSPIRRFTGGGPSSETCRCRKPEPFVCLRALSVTSWITFVDSPQIGDDFVSSTNIINLLPLKKTGKARCAAGLLAEDGEGASSSRCCKGNYRRVRYKVAPEGIASLGGMQ